MKRKYRNYTEQDIIIAAKNTYSLFGLLRALDLKPAGGNFINMKRKLQKLNIDTSHWTGKAWNKDKQLKDYKDYTRAASIKIHLLRKLGSVCSCCKRTIWLEKPIPLELHHIDGDRTNNTEENLELLCPNCHYFTDNYRNRLK